MDSGTGDLAKEEKLLGAKRDRRLWRSLLVRVLKGRGTSKNICSTEKFQRI